MVFSDTDPKRLRARFLDVQLDQQPGPTLNGVAHRLFEIDRRERIIEVGLGHLADTLGLQLPNRHDAFQRVWRRMDPVAYDDVLLDDSLALEPAAQPFSVRARPLDSHHGSGPNRSGSFGAR